MKKPPGKIRVLLVKLKKEPELVEVEASIEGFRRLISGADSRTMLEWIDLDGAYLICDEEGKLKKLPANRWFLNRGKAEDLLVGDFFICEVENSKEVSIGDEQAARWSKKFALLQSEA